MKPPVGLKNLKPSGAARSRVDSNFIWLWIDCDSTRVHFFELIEWHTTFSDGCLGSHNDEERSEMRYVMRIARPRESLILWTHIALPGNSWEHAYLSVSELLSASSHIHNCVRWLDFGDACCPLTMNCPVYCKTWGGVTNMASLEWWWGLLWCGVVMTLSWVLALHWH